MVPGVDFCMCVVYDGVSGQEEKSHKTIYSHSISESKNQIKIRILTGNCRFLKL